LLSTGVGVRSANFTVNYDPALLSVDAVKLGTSVAVGTTFDFTIPSPGSINIIVTNANDDLSANAGQLALVSLLREDTANPGQFLSLLVPATAPYRASHALGISNLQLTGAGGAIITPVADAGIHVIAFAGELSGNQAYNSPDASFAQQFVLHAASFGLAAYPLTDPLIVADTNNNGSVQGSDVSQIQRLILNLPSPFVPPRPTGGPAPLVAGDSTSPDSALAALWGTLYPAATIEAIDDAHGEEDEVWYLEYFS
jgi:hypothetical protein